MTLRRLGDGTFQYDIVVRDDKDMTESIFRTRRLISDIGVDALRGRGTRVWEVVKIDSSGKDSGDATNVLKDVWVDDDRKREGEILRLIRQAAREDGAECFNALNNYLLTIMTCGDVFLGENPDSTRRWSLPDHLSLKRVTTEPNAVGKIKSH